MNRKEITKQYKERKLRGGVYKITNTQNGKYLLSSAANLTSIHSHFQFALKTGSAVDPRLKKDWAEFGAAAFQLEILEELEQGENQTEAQFGEELKLLEQLHRANLLAEQTY